MSATLFVLALGQTINEANLDKLMVNKSVQILTPDDVDTLASDRQKLNRVFCGNVQAVKKTWLEINEKKTMVMLYHEKYIEISRKIRMGS